MKKAAGMAVLLGGLLLGGQALADGAGLFAQHCSSCHGNAGVGIDGIAPPLHNPALWQQLGDSAPQYLSGVWAGGMSGKLEVNGQLYVGLVMPPQPQVPAAELQQIADYVLQTLNGSTQQVTAAQIEAARAAPLSHQQLRSLRKGG